MLTSNALQDSLPIILLQWQFTHHAAPVTVYPSFYSMWQFTHHSAPVTVYPSCCSSDSLPFILLQYTCDSLSSADYTSVWDWFGLLNTIYFAWHLWFVFSPPPDKFLKKKPTLKLHIKDVTLLFNQPPTPCDMTNGQRDTRTRFSPIIRVFPVSTIHLFMYHRRYIVSVIGSIVK